RALEEERYRSRHNAGSACASRPRSCSREAAAMLLDPARIAVLLPQLGGLLLPPCRCAPSLQLGVLVTTVPLRRHRHDTGVDDAPCSPWPQDAGRSGRTASRSARPWPAS